MISKFNPKYILSSTVGGDAKYSGFLNNFISVQDYEEELNCNLVDLKSMQSIMIWIDPYRSLIKSFSLKINLL